MTARRWRISAARLIAVLALLILARTSIPAANVPDGPEVYAVGLPLPAAPVTPGPLSGDMSLERLAGRVGRADAWFLNGQIEDDKTAVPASEPALVPRTSGDPLTETAYLPLVLGGGPLVECRGLWVTRYDWTDLQRTPGPEAVDAIVAKASAAGFNTIFFQVRAAGDAYYEPGLEPWAARLTAGPISETLGVDPGWDPLAHMLEASHAEGMQVHAYINVYTAWLSPPTSAYGELWPPATKPPSMFDRFTYGPEYPAHPGVYGLGMDWRQHDTSGPMLLSWGQYLWASPGLDAVQAYLAAVVEDVASRYPVDGVHLDRVRYAGPAYSYDPDSNAAAGSIKTPERNRWQRDRVTAWVREVTDRIHRDHPGMWTSAAVWPYYVDRWGWGVSEGYHDYYQDAKLWAAEGSVDRIAPMMYLARMDDLADWRTVLGDFADDPGLSRVYPGVGGFYSDFAEIAARIESARQSGAPGHVVFSYSGIDQQGHWDAFAEGPYRFPAQPPQRVATP